MGLVYFLGYVFGGGNRVILFNFDNSCLNIFCIVVLYEIYLDFIYLF